MCSARAGLRNTRGGWGPAPASDRIWRGCRNGSRTYAGGAHRQSCPWAPPARAGYSGDQACNSGRTYLDSASGVPVRSPLTTSLPRRAARGCPESAHGDLSGWTRLLFRLAPGRQDVRTYFLPSDGRHFKGVDGCTVTEARSGDERPLCVAKTHSCQAGSSGPYRLVGVGAGGHGHPASCCFDSGRFRPPLSPCGACGKSRTTSCPPRRPRRSRPPSSRPDWECGRAARQVWRTPAPASSGSRRACAGPDPG